MFWLVIVGVIIAGLVYRQSRCERGLNRAQRARLNDALNHMAVGELLDPFERFDLDIGKGPELFISDTVDGIEFTLSREIRTPRFRGRRYWIYLKNEPEFWTMLLPKGAFARKIDALFEKPLTLEQSLAALRAAGFGEELIKEAETLGKMMEAAPQKKEEAPCDSLSPPTVV